MENEIKLSDKVVKILESHSIRCFDVVEQDKEYYVEIEFSSDLGEDVIFTVWFDEITERSFAEGFKKLFEEFDPEEHAAMWWENRKRVAGVPQSLRQLLNDADSIYELLENVTIELAQLKGD